jgi:hypothetical protein
VKLPPAIGPYPLPSGGFGVAAGSASAGSGSGSGSGAVTASPRTPQPAAFVNDALSDIQDLRLSLEVTQETRKKEGKTAASLVVVSSDGLVSAPSCS